MAGNFFPDDNDLSFLSDEQGPGGGRQKAKPRTKSRLPQVATYGEVRSTRRDLGEEFQAMSLTPAQPSQPNPPLRDMPIISSSPPGPRQPLPPAADMLSTSALNVSYAGAVAQPPPVRPRPPPKNPAAPFQSPIIAQPREATAPPDTSKLMKRIKELEEQHAAQLREKNMEIHFLRSTLAVHAAPHLETVDQLMCRRPLPQGGLEGWVKFEDLKKVTDMSPAEVLKEIDVRGYKDTYTYDPKKPPTVKDHSQGLKTISQDSFFRGGLSDLREKTMGFPVPLNRVTALDISKMNKEIGLVDHTHHPMSDLFSVNPPKPNPKPQMSSKKMLEAAK